MIGEVTGEVTIKKFRRNGWLPAGHDGELTYTRCFQEIVPAIDGRGRYSTGLTEEDEKFLEDKMNLSKGTLSSYNKEFWGKFRIRVQKDGNSLDPQNSYSDLLEYKVLMAHELVANSEVEKMDSPLAEYVLTNIQQEAEVESKIFVTKRNAYQEFATMSYEDMVSYLKVVGKRVSEDTSREIVEAAVGKDIEAAPKNFMNVIKDPAFKLKVFITDCIAKGALIKNGSKYSLKGGDIIGYSLEETIVYLAKEENQEVYISLKSKLEV